MSTCLTACIKELSKLRALCDVLAPIAEITVLAQGERYATLKRFPFWISKLLRFYEGVARLSSSVDEEHKDGARFLRSELMRRGRFKPMLTDASLALKAAALCPLSRGLNAFDSDINSAYETIYEMTPGLCDAVWKSIAEDAIIALIPEASPPPPPPVLSDDDDDDELDWVLKQAEESDDCRELQKEQIRVEVRTLRQCLSIERPAHSTAAEFWRWLLAR
jgi:hypothetical protein